MREVVIFDETVPAPSRKKGHSMDDPKRRRKEVLSFHLENARRVGALAMRLRQGEDVREEVSNHIREMVDQSVLG